MDLAFTQCVFRLSDFRSLHLSKIIFQANSNMPTAISVCFVGQKNLKTYEDKVRSVQFSWRVNLLAEGTEGVAEGFGCQMEQSLQEHVDLQRVEALPLIWTERKERKRTK